MRIIKVPTSKGILDKDKKGIQATCPFCKGKLWIDPATGEVLHQEAFQKDTGKDFDKFLNQSSQEDKILEEKFKKAQERRISEENRKRNVQLFGVWTVSLLNLKPRSPPINRVFRRNRECEEVKNRVRRRQMVPLV